MPNKIISPENKAKINLWLEKLKQLEEVDLPKAKIRIGQSADTGDWHENAEFEDAIEQERVIQTRIDDIKRIIRPLSK